MSDVLFLYEREMPTIKLLREKYTVLTKSNVAFLPVKDVSAADIDAADVVVLIRPSDPLSLGVAKKASGSGALVVFYTDDDLIGLPPTAPFSGSRKKLMRRTAGASDLVLAANPYICRKYSRFVPSHRYSETITSVDYLDHDAISRKLQEAPGDRVKIVYAAGNGHEVVFQKFVGPILGKLNDRYGDRISLSFVGVHPEVEIPSEGMKVTYKAGMSLDEYRRYMSESGFDIGLAPLEDTEFNKCKHYNKYLEYTASGITGVYSDCEPYTNAVTDGKNGFLAENTPENWYETICRAVDDAQKRKDCLANARDHISSCYTAKAFEEKLYGDIPELVGYTGERVPCRSIGPDALRYKLFLAADKAYLLSFYLKHNKKYVVEKIRSVISEKKKES